MTKILKTDYADSGALDFLNCMEEVGMSHEEAIPAMIQAILSISKTFVRPDDVLDEAAQMLADGFVE